MLKVADGRSVQRVVAQSPLLGKSLSKVNAADNGTRHMTSFYNETLLSHSTLIPASPPQRVNFDDHR